MSLDKDEVLKLAKECGCERIAKSFKSMNEVFYAIEFSESELLSFANAIATAQREKDAKICEDVMMYNEDDPGETFANAIRANKE